MQKYAWLTSFPGRLSPAPEKGDGKKRDPGNEVDAWLGSRCYHSVSHTKQNNIMHFIIQQIVTIYIAYNHMVKNALLSVIRTQQNNPALYTRLIKAKQPHYLYHLIVKYFAIC